jgi:hypothetical protein
LARDRGLILLREAHLRGHLDLRQARPFDRDWWHGAGWTLDWLEQQLAGEVWRLKYQLHLALLDYDLDAETFKLHWEQAREAQVKLRAVLLPWLDEEQTALAAGQNMTRSWKDIWGDPADPAVAERIRTTAEALRARNQALAR